MTGCGKQTEDVIDAFVAPLQVGLRIDILNSLEVVMRRFLLMSALAFGTIGSSSAAARASSSPPMPITVTFVGPRVVTGYWQAGGNTFLTFTQEMTLSGGVTGSLTESARLELHPDGSGNDQARLTGTWTVDGKTGDVSVIASLSIEPNRPTPAAGHFIIVSATGGLAGLHGEGTVTPGSTGAALIAYLSFDP
jgi:hypothetical protein